MGFLANYKINYTQKIILIAVMLFLFMSPQFWFGKGAFDACGDDPKLQFYAPENYLSNFSLYTWSSYNALSTSNLPYPNYVFVLMPQALKKIGFSPGQIEKIFYGLILSFGFLFTTLSIKELFKISSIDDNLKFWTAVIGALLFVLSPLIQYTDWIARLSSVIFAIFLYPAMFYFLISAINRRSVPRLFFGACLSSIFSFAIYVPLPWFFAFLTGVVLFLAAYICIYRDRFLLVFKYVLIYVIFIILLNLSWINILAGAFLFSGDIPMLANGVIGIDVLKESAGFVKDIAFNFNMLYSLLFLPSKNFVGVGSMFKNFFYYKALFVFLPLPLVLAGGLWAAKKTERKILAILLLPLVMLAYFITVNITDIGVKSFTVLIMKVPGFIMFRNFYGKFPIVFSFFYGMTLSATLAILISKIKKRWVKTTIITVLLCVVIALGSPLLSGRIIGVSPSGGIHEDLCPVIPETHFKAMDIIKADKTDSRVLVFPLSFAQYMCFKGTNKEAYVAVPYIKVLTGHDELSGMWSFTNPCYNVLPRIVTTLIGEYEFKNFSKILWLMNTKYLYLYKDIACENAQMFIFKYALIDKMGKELLATLPVQKIKDLGDIGLYALSYKNSPAAISALSSLTAVDNKEWLSKLVYTDYLNPENKPLITFGGIY
ncbi:MAG: hypothetical protein ABH836_01355 [Candidatus Omnitrophota bacterium]